MYFLLSPQRRATLVQSYIGRIFHGFLVCSGSKEVAMDPCPCAFFAEKVRLILESSGRCSFGTYCYLLMYKRSFNEVVDSAHHDVLDPLGDHALKIVVIGTAVARPVDASSLKANGTQVQGVLE